MEKTMAHEKKTFEDESERNYEVVGDEKAVETAEADGTEEPSEPASSDLEPEQGRDDAAAGPRDPRRWPRVDEYFRSLRRSLESPVEERKQDETLATLGARRPELAAFTSTRELVAILYGGKDAYAQKDVALTASSSSISRRLRRPRSRSSSAE